MDSLGYAGKETLPTNHQEMMSPQVNELAAALAKAQGQIHAAEKTGENPHFNSTYATLAAVWSACREALSLNGLSVVQAVLYQESKYYLITTLMHTSGQWHRGSMPLLLTKQDMQGLGSAVSYARRYSLAAMVGVAQEDDDGEKSVSRPSKDEKSWRPEDNPQRTTAKPAPLPPSKNPSPVAPRPTGAPTPKPAVFPIGAPPAGAAPATTAVGSTPVALGSSGEWHPGLPELADVKSHMGGKWTTPYFNEYLLRNFMKERLSELNQAQYHTLINGMQEDNFNRNNPPNWQDEPSGDPRG